ncbi:MAG: 4-(cytidine 5'-diphospho)-2-C-methyl-D-erythritol kinase [Rubrivivax sp.]|nr:4-(cytidine 5'-diphospho)-2-C-methyl-D-erythritol kinase [Rubrivivax sp.]
MTLRALYDVPAPAKLNLFLHVVGRRADGYHLLQSLFAMIDWADRLHFERRDDGRLARHDLRDDASDHPFAALPAEDLCLRAARALAAASGTTLGADIHLQKRLPAGAGLGGGSSDAASTLLALNRLWGLHWPRERLAAIGLALGADVPFFVRGANAFVEGIGDLIRPVQLPVLTYAVVKPPASLATAEIFGHPRLKRDTARIALAACGEGGDAAVILSSSSEDSAARGSPASPAGHPESIGEAVAHGFGRNDLQPVAEERCPEVAEVARWLVARFGNSRMTGSGSAVFARVVDASGMAASPEAMPAATGTPSASLADLPPGWLGRMCRGLARHPLADWAR